MALGPPIIEAPPPTEVIGTLELLLTLRCFEVDTVREN